MVYHLKYALVRLPLDLVDLGNADRRGLSRFVLRAAVILEISQRHGDEHFQLVDLIIVLFYPVFQGLLDGRGGDGAFEIHLVNHDIASLQLL